MASTKLTDYERERLENIRRNNEMMASLKIHTIATELSHTAKRTRDEAKLGQNKKPKADTSPIIVRRSLRSRGMSPDAKKLAESRTLGPLSMRESYRGEKSDQLLIEKILKIANESQRNDLTGRVRVCKDEDLGASVKKEGNGVEAEDSSEAKVCETENSSFLVKKEIGGLEFCRDRVRRVENSSSSVEEEEENEVSSMSLKPKNIVRILSGQIMALRFFPCASSRMIVAGTQNGDVGFWNLDHEIDEDEGENGVYTYHTHSMHVSGILIHPHCLSKVVTSSYDGSIRSMNAEKEVFDLIYSGKNSIFSISQRSSDVKCLYFGEGCGGLNIWDERTRKCSTQRILHADRINSIDFSSENPNLMATSSTDGKACIWDLRSIDSDKPKCLNVIDHGRSVHSAYFSPSGKCLATSFANTVYILGGDNFDKSSRIQPENRNGRWISAFKAIWGWSDSYIFTGNTKGGVDIISPTLKKTIFTLRSPNVKAIPCRFDVHPYNVGMLAGATRGDQVYVWTSS